MTSIEPVVVPEQGDHPVVGLKLHHTNDFGLRTAALAGLSGPDRDGVLIGLGHTCDTVGWTVCSLTFTPLSDGQDRPQER